MTDLHFKMDSRWNGYHPPFTQESFVKLSESIINPLEDVPDIIKKKLERVKSIIILSSVDYELLDVAQHLMYSVLELALKMKYEQINNSSTQKGLKGLLFWAKENLYLSLNKNAINFYSGLRNDFAHLNRPKDLHGTISTHLIKDLNNLINDLYSH